MSSVVRHILKHLSLVLLLQGCAAVSVQPPLAPLEGTEMSAVLEDFQAQAHRVRSFFFCGRLSAERSLGGSEAKVAVAGTKVPLRMKIEIAHSWGRPLFHVLVHDQRVQILSFSERKYYFGNLDVAVKNKKNEFLAGALNARQLWAVLRGFPAVKEHTTKSSKAGDQLELLSESGEILQVFELYRKSRLPHRVVYPGMDVRILFSEYKETNGIIYAREVSVKDNAKGTTLTFFRNQITFNGEIPPGIFELHVPSGYEKIPLG